jgi:hypothetical protein
MERSSGPSRLSAASTRTQPPHLKLRFVVVGDLVRWSRRVAQRWPHRFNHGITSLPEPADRALIALGVVDDVLAVHEAGAGTLTPSLAVQAWVALLDVLLETQHAPGVMTAVPPVPRTAASDPVEQVALVLVIVTGSLQSSSNAEPLNRLKNAFTFRDTVAELR